MTNHDSGIHITDRSRRPPLDPVNALISFLYALPMHDCRSARESCGLDPQCGFLHRARPGRPSLALDLMEEFRAFLAALSLFNRQQITLQDIDIKENGAVLLKEDSGNKVLAAWQERKQDEITHPLLAGKTTTPAGRWRLRRMDKICLDYGQRVQNSVFECKLDLAQLVTFKARLPDNMGPETDSLRFDHLGSNWHHEVEHHGAKQGYEIDGSMIL